MAAPADDQQSAKAAIWAGSINRLLCGAHQLSESGYESRGDTLLVKFDSNGEVFRS